MAAIEFHEHSKRFKELMKKYKKNVDSKGFPTYQFFDREEIMMPIIGEALKTGVPVKWDMDTCY